MQVVDAVEIHVLCVPGKSCLPHAKVEVGSVDPLDDDATLVLHHVQEGVQVPNVPLVHVLEHNRDGLCWECHSSHSPQLLPGHRVGLIHPQHTFNTLCFQGG